MSDRPNRRPLRGLVVSLVLTFAVAALASVASVKAPAFYAALDKPAWAPPAGVFGPVWTLLYAMMAIAAWLVWKARGLRDSRAALTLYGVQLAANALWSFLFFAWGRGALAFVDIVVLWLLIAATFVAFWRIRAAAGLLLVPYLAWVSFATALNYAVWQRNPALLG